MKPFTTRKSGDTLLHEPHLPHLADRYTVRYIDSFWSRSFVRLPLLGISLIAGGFLSINFRGAIVDMAREAHLFVKDPNFLPENIAIYLGFIIAIKGILNPMK